MPLPLTVSCFSKIEIGFTFLVPAHLGSPWSLSGCVVVQLVPTVVQHLTGFWPTQHVVWSIYSSRACCYIIRHSVVHITGTVGALSTYSIKWWSGEVCYPRLLCWNVVLCYFFVSVHQQLPLSPAASCLSFSWKANSKWSKILIGQYLDSINLINMPSYIELNITYFNWVVQSLLSFSLITSPLSCCLPLSQQSRPFSWTVDSGEELQWVHSKALCSEYQFWRIYEPKEVVKT